jgi:hypothetical protein
MRERSVLTVLLVTITGGHVVLAALAAFAHGWTSEWLNSLLVGGGTLWIGGRACLMRWASSPPPTLLGWRRLGRLAWPGGLFVWLLGAAFEWWDTRHDFRP